MIALINVAVAQIAANTTTTTELSSGSIVAINPASTKKAARVRASRTIDASMEVLGLCM